MPSSTTSSGSRSFWIGTLCYLNAAFVWGLNIPLTSALFASYDPFWLAPLRLSIASCLLALAVLISLGSASLKSPIPAGRVLLMSLCVSCFFTLYNLGLLHSNTITAAAIMAGSPVYGAVTTRLMTGARLEKGFWGAALLTIIGASIAIYGRSLCSQSPLGRLTQFFRSDGFPQTCPSCSALFSPHWAPSLVCSSFG
jgi:drug/metabolite transporter (DMT)-like permease